MKTKTLRITCLIFCLVPAFGLVGCRDGGSLNSDANPSIDTTTSKGDSEQLQQQLDAANLQIAGLQSQLDSANALIVELQKNRPLNSWLPLLDLATERDFADLTLVENLEAVIGDNDGARLAIMHLMVITPSQYDRALWPSLLSIAKLDPNNLQVLRDQLILSLKQLVPIANVYIDNGALLGMTNIDLSNWMRLAG